MGDRFALDGDAALEEPRGWPHKQTPFPTTRLRILGGDNTDGRTVALLVGLGLALTLGAVQGGMGRLGLWLGDRIVIVIVIMIWTRRFFVGETIV